MSKLNKAQMAEQVKEYQGYYPGKTLYFTEDGNCFLDKSPCVDHANKTKQKWEEVVPYIEPVADEDPEGVTPEQVKEMLLQGNLSDDMPYQLAKDMVRILQLKPVSQKKDDLLVALEEFKNTLTVKSDVADVKTDTGDSAAADENTENKTLVDEAKADVDDQTQNPVE